MIDLRNRIKKREFDKTNGCHAFVCYSGKECNSRDENGSPLYVDTETIKKEIQIEKKY